MRQGRKISTFSFGTGIDPLSVFTGGSASLSAGSDSSASAFYLDMSALSTSASFYIFGFAIDPNTGENVFCIYRYKNGSMTSIFNGGASLYLRLYSSGTYYIYINSQTEKHYGILCAMYFPNAVQADADLLFSKMSIKHSVGYGGSTGEYLSLEADYPSTGDYVFCACRGSTTAYSSKAAGIYKSTNGSASGTLICGNENIVSSGGVWKAAAKNLSSPAEVTKVYFGMMAVIKFH